MRVNVLMSTYNRTQLVGGTSLVERAILSFLYQDYDDSVLTILNDGSTDHTKSILDKYEGNERIEIHNFTENKRPPNNWNWLWERSKGDLICQLHDDDEFTKNSLSIRVEKFKDKSIQVVYGGATTQNITVTDKVTYLADPPDKKRILVDEYINFTTLMYRPDIPFRFDSDLRYYFDWLFKIRCINECKVDYVSEPVMLYTVHHGQESNKCRREKMNDQQEALMREKLKLIYK